ncbi:MAG TPA: glycosyltransferase [Anaerolineales bacterium]|nr:glycosyltransferase [Anaerolineales bacterium]
MLPSVSVIVPAYNAQQTIGACVTAILHNDYAGRMELWVVDDASTDNTAELARQAGATVLSGGKLHRTGARNLGARHATGEILLFTDSDCVPHPDWVTQMVAKFVADPQVMGVKGVYTCQQSHPIARFTQIECEERYDHMAKLPEINMIDTYAAGFRRDIFLQVGGFDEGLAILEDQDLSFRLAAQGLRMVFAPAAKVQHTHLTHAWRYARRKFHFAEWKPTILRRYPNRLWSDSRAPQYMKLQMLLAWAWLAPLGVGLCYAPALWGVLLVGVAFVLSSVPFLARTVRRDPAILPIVLPMLWVRAASLMAGMVKGMAASDGAMRHH